MSLLHGFRIELYLIYQVYCLPLRLSAVSIGSAFFLLTLALILSTASSGRLKNSCLLSHLTSFFLNSSASCGGGGGSVILVIRYAVEASAIP